MKISVSREGLLSAYSSVASVAPSRSPKPILQNLKLVVGDGTTLSATDLEVGIRHTVTGVTVHEPGSVILPTAQIGAILRSSSDAELTIEADDTKLVIKGQFSEFKLPTEDPSLFPEVPEFGASSYHVIAAADLKRLIKRTVFATDVESTRYALGGCLVERGDNAIGMVGTDGRRLARMSAPAEVEREPGFPITPPVIPAKALKLIDRIIDDKDPPVHLDFGLRTAVLIRTAQAVIYSRLVEGRFPRYQDVFPAGEPIKVPLEVGPLLSAVTQAAIVTGDESRGVDFTFDCGMLFLRASTSDKGASTVDLPIDNDSKPITVALDPNYLVDMLRTLDPGETITCEIVDAKTGLVFRTDGYVFCVMPLTRDGR